MRTCRGKGRLFSLYNIKQPEVLDILCKMNIVESCQQLFYAFFMRHYKHLDKRLQFRVLEFPDRKHTIIYI